MSNTLAPRPELIALLDAVKDSPDDDTPRLVLADWLEEHGDEFDAARAQFIRRDIARTRGQAPPVLNQVQRAETELLRRWLEPFRPFIASWSFERGFPHLVLSGPAVLKTEFLNLLPTAAFAFVQLVRLQDDGGPRMEMEAVAALPELRYVSGLSVRPLSPLGANPCAALLSSPNLTGLRQFEFRSAQPGVVGLQALADNAALAGLRKLNLAHNKLGDKAVAALAGAKRLAHLEVLDLSDNNIGDKGAEALAASTAFPRLRELNLYDNPRLTAHARRVLAARFAPKRGAS